MCSWTRIRKSLDVLAKRTCGVDHPPKNRPMLGRFPQGKEFPLRIESLRQLTNGDVNGVWKYLIGLKWNRSNSIAQSSLKSSLISQSAGNDGGKRCL
jgi:hypothetical protein